MEFSEVLHKRRSTRKFTGKPVGADEIEKLIDAAVNAPSACNMQSWHFFVVTDDKIKNGFADVCSAWVASAPVIFVICTDGEKIIERFGEKAEKLFIWQDTALAAENLLLCATDIGLGGCFIGAFDENECRKLVGIPEKYKIAAIIPVGESATEVSPRERKPISDVVTYVGESRVPDENAIVQKPEKFKLCGASLPEAIFDDLNLERATFNNINMHGAKFSDINMSSTFYGGLTMAGSFFGCVDLDGATFENPSFDDATFKNCSFKNVIFENCKFENTIVKKDDNTIIIL